MKKIFSTFLVFFYTFMGFSQDSGGKYEVIERNTMEGTKYGVEKNGEVVIPAEYDYLGDYSSGKFAALKDNKVGVIDTLNNLIIPFKYSYVNDFIGDRTFLSVDQKLAMADDKGNILTPFEYDDILGYENRIARVLVDDKIGYINSDGKTIIKPQFSEGYDCQGQFIVVYTPSWKSLGYQYVQRDFWGNVVDEGDVGMSGKLPVIFDVKGEVIYKGMFGERVDVIPTGELAVVDNYLGSGIRDSKIIDFTGKILHSFQDRTSVSVQDDWIRVSTNTGSGYKVGLINFKGEIALKQGFSSISDLSYNQGTLAKVEFHNGEFFFIDKNINCVEFDGQACPEKS